MRHRGFRRAWFWSPSDPFPTIDQVCRRVPTGECAGENSRCCQGGGRPVAPHPASSKWTSATESAGRQGDGWNLSRWRPGSLGTPCGIRMALLSFQSRGAGGLEPRDRTRRGTSDPAPDQGPQINRSPGSIFFRVGESGALRNSRNGAMARKRDSISENRRGVVATAGGSST